MPCVSPRPCLMCHLQVYVASSLEALFIYALPFQDLHHVSVLDRTSTFTYSCMLLPHWKLLFIYVAVPFQDLHHVSVLDHASTATYSAILQKEGELMYGISDCDIHNLIDKQHVSGLSTLDEQLSSILPWPIFSQIFYFCHCHAGVHFTDEFYIVTQIRWKIYLSSTCIAFVGYHIATKFCTCHDSTAVMPCAKFHSNPFATTWMRVE